MKPALIAAILLLSLLSPPVDTPVPPFAHMTGEEIHIAYCRGELDAREMFLASDLAYVQTKLDELCAYYNGQPDTPYYPIHYEPLPEGLALTEPLTLENAEILSNDTRTQWPIQLKYRVGDYFLYVGFEPWSTEVRSPEEVAGIGWHPNLAYFIPVSDGIAEPYVRFGDICIYVRDYPERLVKGIDLSTGYSMYLEVGAGLQDQLTFTWNGADRVTVQIGHGQFYVMDFSGAMYYGHANTLLPYVRWFAQTSEEYLKGCLRWAEENVLEGETQTGHFRFSLHDRTHVIRLEDGTIETVECRDPMQMLPSADSGTEASPVSITPGEQAGTFTLAAGEQTVTFTGESTLSVPGMAAVCLNPDDSADIVVYTEMPCLFDGVTLQEILYVPAEQILAEQVRLASDASVWRLTAGRTTYTFPKAADTLSYDHYFYYTIENDRLVCRSLCQSGGRETCGEILIEYAYRNGQMEMERILFLYGAGW